MASLVQYFTPPEHDGSVSRDTFVLWASLKFRERTSPISKHARRPQNYHHLPKAKIERGVARGPCKPAREILPYARTMSAQLLLFELRTTNYRLAGAIRAPGDRGACQGRNLPRPDQCPLHPIERAGRSGKAACSSEVAVLPESDRRYLHFTTTMHAGTLRYAELRSVSLK